MTRDDTLDPVAAEPATGFAGVPDDAQRLWTPHRMAYIDGENKPRGDRVHRDDGLPECPFCRAPQQDDDTSLIVHRGMTAFVVLNLYPYSPGHLLVCPHRHVSLYDELTFDETVEVATLTQQAMRVARSVSGPDGFNIGMNQGDVAGAGIAMHLHQHVVPRWLGDANFMPIVGRTKPMPQLLADTRERYARAFAAPGLAGQASDLNSTGSPDA